MENRYYENDDFFRLVELELDECGSVKFYVNGISMQPIIRNGRDSVVLSKLDAPKPQIGSVLLFRFKGRHILHRYVADRDGLMIMRGDNLFSHEYCTPADVVGVVTSICHNGKYISPSSKKWHFITKMHRLYKRIRMYGGNVLRALHLR